jgi:benzoylformate decarboxylase
MPTEAAAIRAFLAPYDRVLVLGAPAFYTYVYSEGPAVPESVELLQVHPDPDEIGRTYPVRLGVVGDAAATAAALAARCRERLGESRSDRVEAARAEREQSIARFEESAAKRYSMRPIAPMAAAHALVRALPADAIVVDEAVTTGPYVRGFHHTHEPGTYLFNRGGGLGWGMPAAVGVQLARPERAVLCVVGDGSALYSPQALWTAARYELPVVFAVVNNREYRILKHGVDRGGGGGYVGMDLVQPPLDFPALASAFGVRSHRAESPDEIADVVRDGLASGAPLLLEVPIGGHADVSR